MLSVAKKPIMLSVVMLNAVMLSVVALMQHIADIRRISLQKSKQRRARTRDGNNKLERLNLVSIERPV
jgi:hypothetical protein